MRVTLLGNRRVNMVDLRIRHMVIFCLKYEPAANETGKFLLDGKTILSAIPGVENFEVMRQVGYPL